MEANTPRMRVLANGDIVDCSRLPSTARNTLYKTELCKHFMEYGTCRYGPKCQFAHGEHELRGVLRHPKYRTTHCKAYSSTGKCQYGSRCRFIHEDKTEDPSPGSKMSKEEASSRTSSQEINLKECLAKKSLAPLKQDKSSGSPKLNRITKDLDLLSMKALSDTTTTASSSSPSSVHDLDPSSTSHHRWPDQPCDTKDAADGSTAADVSRLTIFRRICSREVVDHNVG